MTQMISKSKGFPVNLTKEEHKNRYLSKFINCLVNDEDMNKIYNCSSYDNEHKKSLDLIERVLHFENGEHETAMFHQETTKAEIEEGVAAAFAISSKSKDKSDAFKEEADMHWDNLDYQRAVEAYYKAILYLPWADWKQSLGDLLYRESQCLAELSNVGKLTSAMVLHLACKCKKNLTLTKQEMQNLQDYRDFLATRTKASRKVLSNCEKIKVKQIYNPSLGADRFFVVASSDISGKQDILSEKPWVVYHGVPRRHCAHCNRTLNKYYLCPCPMCIDVSYCDWTCQRSDWNNHKYECRLTAYLSQVPLFLIMLRAYVRSAANPVAPWSKSTNHIEEFVQKKDVKYALNAFRQMIDQKPSSEKMASLSKAQYYAFILLAIEFVHVFTASLDNKLQIEHNDEGEQHELDWQHPLSIVEVIAIIFEDVKRFAGCPYARFTNSLCENARSGRKLNRFIYLVSALIPVVRPNCRYNTNLVIREARLLRATANIQPNELLVVAHTLSKKPPKSAI